MSVKESNPKKVLEERIQFYVGQTNERLSELGARISVAELHLGTLADKTGATPYHGFISISMDYDPGEPDFLSLEDRAPWFKKMLGIAESKYGFSSSFPGTLEYISIDFTETVQDDFAKLTEQKEEVLSTGFDRIYQMASWYCACVDDYEKVIKSHGDQLTSHLKRLDQHANVVRDSISK